MFSRFLFYQQSFAVSRNNEKSYYISVYVKFACDKNPRNVDFIKNTVRQNIGLITLCNILGFYTIIFLNRNMIPRLQIFKIISRQNEARYQ